MRILIAGDDRDRSARCRWRPFSVSVPAAIRVIVAPEENVTDSMTGPARVTVATDAEVAAGA
jgi:hypothetical protein